MPLTTGDPGEQEAWDTFMDERGPVIGIATFALGLPLAFLGLHEPRRAGWMLLLAGVIPIVGKALESRVPGTASSPCLASRGP